MSEFDADEVLHQVSEAITKNSHVFVERQRIPLAMAQGDLLERLYVKLADRLNQADVQVIFDELRHELYQGIEAPPLKELHTVILNCRKCEHAKPEPNLPKWNVADPDCVFVLETPFYSEEHAKFFVSSLVEAGFSSQRVCLTYVNRCPGVQPYTIDEVKNCSSYLFTELQIMKPKLIVPMGGVSTSVLLANERLKDVVNSIIWLGPWPIMPVYSPSYCFKSGENMINAFKSNLVTAYNFCYGAK